MPAKMPLYFCAVNLNSTIMSNPFEIIEEKLGNIEIMLLNLNQRPGKDKNDERTWFDLDEFCKYHPDKPAKATVYGWVSAGSVPFHKTGKKLRFLRSEIDAWLSQGRRKTATEIEEESYQYLKKRKGGDSNE